MIGLLQRVTEASVSVDGEPIARIGPGLLVLLGVVQGDGRREALRLADRVLAYRAFADAEGRMNLDVRQSRGEVLVVPQFTLAADTQKGNRPSFTHAAPPAIGRALFDLFVVACRARHGAIEMGRFGANMQVSLINDGPVTLWLEVRPA